MIKYNNIIKSSVTTDKAFRLKEELNVYSLYVAVDANKNQIKSAVESLFDVKIDSLNVIRVKPKFRRFRGIIGCRKQKKKVYFSLKSDKKLNFMSV